MSNISFWNDNHPLTPKFNELLKNMPSRGSGDTLHTILITIANRIVYDFYNNGNCNIVDSQVVRSRGYSSSWEDDDMEYEYIITDFYSEMLEFVEQFLEVQEKEFFNKFIEYIVNTVKYDYDYNQEADDMYNKFVILIMDIIDRTEDKPVKPIY